MGLEASTAAGDAGRLARVLTRDALLDRARARAAAGLVRPAGFVRPVRFAVRPVRVAIAFLPGKTVSFHSARGASWPQAVETEHRAGSGTLRDDKGARMARQPGSLVLLAAATLAAGVAAADTLVLRDGRRLEGDLVSVRGDTVEFERSGGRRRTERFDRSEVRRIELDESRGRFDDDRDEGPMREMRPGGLREREVSVSASDAWTDAGVDVRAGQTVYFEASGRIRWGADRRDDPGGESGSHHNPNRPLPNRPGAALIGKVGEGSRDYFFIGKDEGPVKIRTSGRLYLGVNDDYLLDNSGSFRVIVHY